jgi:hypothetical protein
LKVFFYEEMATPIVDFPGYSIDRDGNVYKCGIDADAEPKQIKSMLEKKSGFMYVVFKKDGKKKKRMIHRLLAEAFIDNPLKHKYVRHKEGLANGGDCGAIPANTLDNIEWYTTAIESLEERKMWIQKRTIKDKESYVARWKERVDGKTKQKSKWFKTEDDAKYFIEHGVCKPAEQKINNDYNSTTSNTDKVVLTINGKEVANFTGKAAIDIKQLLASNTL